MRKMSKETVLKIIKNKNTPKGLKEYYKKMAKKRGYK